MNCQLQKNGFEKCPLKSNKVFLLKCGVDCPFYVDEDTKKAEP